MKNLTSLFDQIYTEIKNSENLGELASYIPELANVDPDKFGAHITTIDGFQCGLGDNNMPFSIQSISKVLSFCMSYKKLGPDIWERLGYEPSGTAYNSLIQLELEHGIPRNPFINAGAIVIADIMLSEFKNPKKEFLNFVRKLANDNSINYCSKIAASEKMVGYRNIALCNFMKSFNNIKNEPNEVLDLYFDICSIEMTCKQLSQTFLFLANNGICIWNEEKVLTKSKSKRINAIMQTCGFYDESGEFAYKVGLPGKSGVGGGIITVFPKKYAIAVWSPKLNEKGNSYRGMKFLEQFTSLSEDSIF